MPRETKKTQTKEKKGGTAASAARGREETPPSRERNSKRNFQKESVEEATNLGEEEITTTY